MKYLNGKYYVEVKDKRYVIYPTENIKIGELREPKSLGTKCQVFNDIQTGRTQKVIKNQKD